MNPFLMIVRHHHSDLSHGNPKGAPSFTAQPPALQWRLFSCPIGSTTVRNSSGLEVLTVERQSLIRARVGGKLASPGLPGRPNKQCKPPPTLLCSTRSRAIGPST